MPGLSLLPEYSSYFIAGIMFYLACRDGYSRFHVAILIPALAVSSWYAHEAISTFARNVTELDRMIAVGIVWGLYFLFYLSLHQTVHHAKHDVCAWSGWNDLPAVPFAQPGR